MVNKILITGCAGFIGFSLCNYLLGKNKKIQIIGIDNLNSYYDVKLKKNRLASLKKNKPSSSWYVVLEREVSWTPLT